MMTQVTQILIVKADFQLEKFTRCLKILTGIDQKSKKSVIKAKLYRKLKAVI